MQLIEKMGELERVSSDLDDLQSQYREQVQFNRKVHFF